MFAQASQELTEYKGKVKTLFAHPDHDDLLMIEVSDRLTAGDGDSSAQVEGIGKIRSQIIQLIFMHLESCLIPSHFWGGDWDDESQFSVYRALPFPIESVVRFQAWGSFLKRNRKYSQGDFLWPPVVESFLKSDSRHDPMIKLGEHLETSQPGFLMYGPKTGLSFPGSLDAIFLEYHEVFFDMPLTSVDPLSLYYQIQTQTLVVGELLRLLLLPRFQLIDLKLEFGWHEEKGLLLIDGISPDEWRVIDEAGKHYDKQFFRDQGKEDLGLLYQRYFQILTYLREKVEG